MTHSASTPIMGNPSFRRRGGHWIVAITAAVLADGACGSSVDQVGAGDAGGTPGGGIDASANGGVDMPMKGGMDSAMNGGADMTMGGGADGAVSADLGGAPDMSGPPPQIVCTILCKSVADLVAALKAPAPGSTICIADGTYTDAALSFVAPGTAPQPILITAVNPGRPIFNGKTQISMGGSYTTLQGIVLQGGQSAGTSLIEMKSNQTYCDYCRFTELAIVDFDKGNAADVKWVSLYGQHDRVDHCVFSGKTNPGTLLVVWRQMARTDYDLVDHNLFANRPVSGANGNEGIRIGTGLEAASDSFTTIRENLFEAMSADAEVISVKSGANLIQYNTVRRSWGQVTLRNGSGSTVDGNIILTEGVVDAGGIRVIGPNHRVTNNYIEGVRTAQGARGGIVLVSGQPNPMAGGYAQVQNALIAFNTIVDCDQSLILGANANPLAPDKVTLADNAISAARTSVCAPGTGLTNSNVLGNIYFGAPLNCMPANGFMSIDPMLARAADGLMRPAMGSPLIGAAQGMINVTTDIDAQTRVGKFDVGCDQVNGAGPRRKLLGRSDVGPMLYTIMVP